MHAIEIFYLSASALSVVAMGPQIRQMLVSKNTEGLSLITWSVWMSTQLIAMIYSLSIGAWPFFLVSMAWCLFYAVMVTLIVKFRREERERKAEATEEALR